MIGGGQPPPKCKALGFHYHSEKVIGSLGRYKQITLPETNSLHMKMDGWNTIVSFLGWPIFRCYVGFMEGINEKRKGSDYFGG